MVKYEVANRNICRLGLAALAVGVSKGKIWGKDFKCCASHVIERISHKTTILWGNADPVIRCEWADRIPDYFSDATISILDNVGHFVPFEAPLDVIRAVKEHL
ncbi:acetoin dehydrogenase E2 subunit dihydrolipoyllysine-residue acetyltransferase [Bacillus freudenreichii]|nr:acetoin dehydrogenase E2 subunit dihydrolipoyllysine-residue acetyltransferase [Bacillus freudenreichii]